MLPSNPLQHLLSQALARPLVMTSGNLSGRPPALTNAEALADLAGIADGFLLHNREIVQRMDDSVVRKSGEMLRRARGYVPDALALPPGFHDAPPLLALGADMKNTFCLLRGDEAVLSQHFGDLDEEGVEAQWRQALRLMQEIYAFTPQRVVADAHPGYRASRWAASLMLPVERVLHHHAHAAACLAEHRWPLEGGDVIALTLDGIGMGKMANCGAASACGSTIASVSISAVCRRWRCPAATSRRVSRGAICSPTAWRLSLNGRIMPTPPRCASKTGRCWREQSSVVLMRRRHRRAAVCLTPSPARWAVRR